MLIEICEVTRQLQISKDARLTKGTRVFLCAKRVRAKQGTEADWSIELFFKLEKRQREELLLDVDSVLSKSDVPDPAGNHQQWEKVRRLVRDRVLSPNDAWVKVAVTNALRQAKYSLETEMSKYVFVIDCHRRGIFEAMVGDWEVAKRFIVPAPHYVIV